MPEVVKDGLTGFIVDDIEQAVAAVSNVRGLDRLRIRSHFEERFSAQRMAADYLALYAALTTPSSCLGLGPSRDWVQAA